MAILRLSVAAANTSVNAIINLIDASVQPGYIEFYDNSGGMPASVASAPTGILLATLTLAKPSFGSPTNGTATANPTNPSTAIVAGGPYNIGWARIYDGAGNAIMDADVGLNSATATYTINITNGPTVNSGDKIIINSFSLSQPGI
ncbi:MAG: hypothetical protein D6732_05440 [Methanobacteriota archaeon]|nr:MAG: hypothetical protein D6732_05440 [Euryarchaeota archaeon]